MQTLLQLLSSIFLLLLFIWRVLPLLLFSVELHWIDRRRGVWGGMFGLTVRRTAKCFKRRGWTGLTTSYMDERTEKGVSHLRLNLWRLKKRTFSTHWFSIVYFGSWKGFSTFIYYSIMVSNVTFHVKTHFICFMLVHSIVSEI